MFDKKANMSKSSFMLAIACAHASTPATDMMCAKKYTSLLFVLKFLIVSFLKKKKSNKRS